MYRPCSHLSQMNTINNNGFLLEKRITEKNSEANRGEATPTAALESGTDGDLVLEKSLSTPFHFSIISKCCFGCLRL